MKNKDILLSICIPTYNGGDKLKITLNSINNALNDYSDIEVIVSDNCSEDNTPDILSHFSNLNQFKIYKNKQNIGFNKNMILLIDKYSNGKYCWIIGDDDFIDCDSLYHIRNILLNDNIEYLSINYRLMDILSYKSQPTKKRKDVLISKSTFAQAIEKNAQYSNILSTFMSSSIFLKEKISNFNKDIFSHDSWENYYSTFPNSYLMCKFFNNSQCGVISTPLFTALIHEKSWDNKMDLITFKYLPDLYNFYLKTGIKSKDLQNNKTLIQESIFLRIIFHLKSRKIGSIPYNLFIKSLFWKSTYKLIKNKMINR